MPVVGQPKPALYGLYIVSALGSEVIYPASNQVFLNQSYPKAYIAILHHYNSFLP